MSSKNETIKLKLNKTTVANLGQNEMIKIKGGSVAAGPICPSSAPGSCVALCVQHLSARICA